jgi:hypothetical protein
MATPRIAWGSVAANGQIISGSNDFTVTNTSSGRYTIAFNQGFASTPAVVGSQNNFDNANQSNLDGVAFPFVNTNSFQINTGDGAGKPGNRSFAFVAIGI